MGMPRSKRLLYSGTGALVQNSLADGDGSRALTDDPKNKEEWDEFDGEQDGHRVKCETAVDGVSAVPIRTNQWRGTYSASMDIQAIIQ